MDKLYIVVRADLSPGLQIAQACHAVRLFTAVHPELDRHWYEHSSNIVVLQVPSEEALLDLKSTATERKIALALFTEPDLQDAATALALSADCKPLVAPLRLALQAA